MLICCCCDNKHTKFCQFQGLKVFKLGNRYFFLVRYQNWILVPLIVVFPCHKKKFHRSPKIKPLQSMEVKKMPKIPPISGICKNAESAFPIDFYWNFCFSVFTIIRLVWVVLVKPERFLGGIFKIGSFISGVYSLSTVYRVKKVRFSVSRCKKINKDCITE